MRALSKNSVLSLDLQTRAQIFPYFFGFVEKSAEIKMFSDVPFFEASVRVEASVIRSHKTSSSASFSRAPHRKVNAA